MSDYMISIIFNIIFSIIIVILLFVQDYNKAYFNRSLMEIKTHAIINNYAHYTNDINGNSYFTLINITNNNK